MMKKTIRLQILNFAAVVALLGTGANTALSAEVLAEASVKVEPLPEQTEFPQIIRQPEDQGVYLGSTITLSVKAENADGYQWVRNGEVLEGQTHSTLTIEKAAIEDVGLYTAYVFKDDEAVPTRAANLNVYASSFGGGTITVFGTPLLGNGGSPGSCPGPYAGYVTYIKPPPQWGWLPSTGTTIHTATDTNRTDTTILYGGRYGDNGCALTTVTVPHPTISPKYRFTLYFPNNVPTNAYALVLEGFDP